VAGCTPEDADGGGSTCDGGAECSLEGWCLQINLLATVPDIGRQTDHPHIRILFVDDYGIEYEQIGDNVLIIDIYSCLTNPALRKYRKE